MGPRVSALRDPTTLIVGALAVHRLTRLVTDDELTRPWRDRITRWTDGQPHPAHPRLAYLITCPWCVSVYAAAGWTALTVAAPRVAATVGAALAWSSTAGLLASLG